LLKIENQFPINILCFLWAIGARFGLWPAYIKKLLGIPTLPVIKASYAKIGNLISAQ